MDSNEAINFVTLSASILHVLLCGRRITQCSLALPATGRFGRAPTLCKLQRRVITMEESSNAKPTSCFVLDDKNLANYRTWLKTVREKARSDMIFGV